MSNTNLQRRHDLWDWSAFDQLLNLRNEFNRFFEAPFGQLTRSSEFFNGWAPALDLYEDKDNLIVKAELPGLKRDDIEIALHEGVLSISGERKHEAQHQGNVSRSERFFGRFQRAVSLPKHVDAHNVTATYRDGILTVTLPKAEEAKPKQIQVKAS